MFRTATTAASVAIAAVVALNPAAAFAQSTPGATAPPRPVAIPAPPPPPPAPPPIAAPAPAPATPEMELPEGPQVLAPAIADAATMAAKINEAMKGQAFGWQFAIAQNGKFVVADAKGTARSKFDNGGTELKMTPTMRYEIASVTKNITAVATMKLLRMRGLTVESSIDTFLPASWTRGAGYRQVTYKQLLTHTSGLAQTEKTAACKDVCANDWDGMRARVAVGLLPASPANRSRVYSNSNYALLRILNAQMWKAAGGTVMGKKAQYVETTNYKGDEIKKKVYVDVVLPVNGATNARYAMDFVAKRILNPAGINNVNCVAASQTAAGLNYPAGAKQTSKGELLSWPSDQCAGNAGMRLSSVELVRYLAHLRHGNIIDPADLAKMDELRAGWREATNLPGSTPAGVFWHGGGLTGAVGTDIILHTCAITFPDGTEASFIVNSTMGTLIKCSVLRDAWVAAR
jgi:CubicO group peptidase (beta-lactamase class C family)